MAQNPHKLESAHLPSVAEADPLATFRANRRANKEITDKNSEFVSPLDGFAQAMERIHVRQNTDILVEDDRMSKTEAVLVGGLAIGLAVSGLYGAYKAIGNDNFANTPHAPNSVPLNEDHPSLQDIDPNHPAPINIPPAGE